MAKDSERKTARILYVEQGKTAKEIAELVGVSEKTISGAKGWVNKYGWKSARTARITGHDNRIGNLRQIIDDFATDRLALNAELKDLTKSGDDKKRITEIRHQIAHIDNSVANWNKTLENADKESNVSLGTYLNIMDKIFNSLRTFDIKIYLKTIAFQEQHINEKSIELG